MLPIHGDSSSISQEQITQAYLNAIELIDDRVAPYLGKATTRALVQGAATRIQHTYPFLSCLTNRPYTDIVPYADVPDGFWTGFYTSRANLKKYIRDVSHNLHASCELYSYRVLD